MSVDFGGINEGCWIRFRKGPEPVAKLEAWFQVMNKRGEAEWDLQDQEGNAHYVASPSLCASWLHGTCITVQRGTVNAMQGKSVPLNKADHLVERATAVVANRLNAANLTKEIATSTPLLSRALHHLICDYVAFPFNGGNVDNNPDVFFFEPQAGVLIAESVVYYDPTTYERTTPEFHESIFKRRMRHLTNFNIRDSAAAVATAQGEHSALRQFIEDIITLLHREDSKNFKVLVECAKALMLEQASDASKKILEGAAFKADFNRALYPALIADRPKTLNFDIEDRNLVKTLPAYIQEVTAMSGFSAQEVETDLYKAIMHQHGPQIEKLLIDYSVAEKRADLIEREAASRKAALVEQMTAPRKEGGRAILDIEAELPRVKESVTKEVIAHEMLLQRILEIGSPTP